MPRTLPASTLTKIQQSHIDTPFAWLWKIQANRTATGIPTFNMTDYREEIVFNSQPWVPYPIRSSVIAESGEGDLASVDISINDVARIADPWFFSERGFMGLPATGYLLNVEDDELAFRFDGRVAGAGIRPQGTGLRIELQPFYRIEVPFDRYNARRCRHGFGGKVHGIGRCPYVINAAAAFTTCDKTIAACIARGLDMIARNLPALLPLYFGGFLGIPQA